MTAIRVAPATGKLIAAFAAVYLVWGSTYLAIHFAIDTMPPFLMLGARYLAAGVLVFGWLVVTGRPYPSFRMWRNAAVVGTLTLSVGTGAVAWAEQWVSSGVAALLVTTVPGFMVIIDWRWKGAARPNRYIWAGLALGLVGVIMLVDPGELVASLSGASLGALVILIGSLSWSVGSIIGRDAHLPEDPLASAALQMIAGGMSLVLVGSVTGEWSQVDVAGITGASWLAWSYLVVFGSIIAFGSFVWLMRNANPARVATYAFVNPIVAVFLGWLLAGEVVGYRVIAAVVVLVTAVVLISRFGHKRVRPLTIPAWLRAFASSMDFPARSLPRESTRCPEGAISAR